MQTACGIYDKDIIAVVHCMGNRLFGYFHRIALTHIKYRYSCL